MDFTHVVRFSASGSSLLPNNASPTYVQLLSFSPFSSVSFSQISLYHNCMPLLAYVCNSVITFALIGHVKVNNVQKLIKIKHEHNAHTGQMIRIG